jgi:hypothetical protein
MTNTDRVRDFLRSITPADASNAEISARTGVRPHQQVFMITRSLFGRGEINGAQAGHEWRYWHGTESQPSQTSLQQRARSSAADEPYPWDTADLSECRIGMTWTPIGRVTLRGDRLEFPEVQSVPGLYRFQIRNGSSKSAYIGESENLARRFGLYRDPGPSQQTNVRLNQIFRTALTSGAEIAVAIVTTGAWMDMVGVRAQPDFSIKAVRRLFEQAALVVGHDISVESLNR